jgi:hypothetical protein
MKGSLQGRGIPISFRSLFQHRVLSNGNLSTSGGQSRPVTMVYTLGGGSPGESSDQQLKRRLLEVGIEVSIRWSLILGGNNISPDEKIHRYGITYITGLFFRVHCQNRGLSRQ